MLLLAAGLTQISAHNNWPDAQILPINSSQGLPYLLALLRRKK